MVTPYPPGKCGIGIYASKLVVSLAKYANIVVIATKNGQHERILDGKLRILRSWKKGSPLYLLQIVKGVAQESPDIVHVQHEYLAYGPRKYSVLFPGLLLLLRLLRRPIILTMHSVVRRSTLSEDFFFVHQAGRRFGSLKRTAMVVFTRMIANLSDVIIVHNNYMRSALVRDYEIERKKIFVVPHGFDASETSEPAAEAKKRLGLGEKRVLLFFGFVIPGKGVEVLISSFSKVSRRVSNAILVIAGQYHPRLKTEFPRYLGVIETLIRDLDLGDKVIFENRFIGTDRLQLYVSAADIVVLPYVDDSILGASGALGTIASQGKAVIATRIPRFLSDLSNGVSAIIVDPNEESQLVEAIVRVLEDPSLAERLQMNLHRYALTKGWDATSSMTFKLYLRMKETTALESWGLLN